jgi:hypothetical protein
MAGSRSDGNLLQTGRSRARPLLRFRRNCLPSPTAWVKANHLANFIWSICNLLRGPYKRNEYRKVILPLTVLRRFDCLLAPTKERVLARSMPKIKAKPESVVRSLLEKITGRPFYNLSKLDLPKLLDDPNQLAPNLNSYINGFSKNVREIMERFAFDQQIARWPRRTCSMKSSRSFARIDLSLERVDNMQMGYVFEELIRIGAEQSNEEAGRALHAARGDQADGQPAALAGKGPAPQPRGQNHLRPGLRHRRHALGRRKLHPRPQRRRQPAALRPGLERRGLGRLQVRHAHQGRGRRQHHPRRHLHPGRLRPRRRRQEDAPSTTCWPIRPSAWSGSSSSVTSSTSATPSDTACRASTTARCSSSSTCSRRCGAQGRRQPHRHRLQRLAALHRRRRQRREQHPPVDHRKRLAGGRGRPARPALLQHRHLHLHLGAHQPQGTPERKGKVQLIDARSSS